MTNLFLNNGVPSVQWRDSKNILHTCTEQAYNKIFAQAMKETKCGRDHEIEEKVDKLQNKEKKVDEIANSNEDIIKQKEEQLKQLQDQDRKESIAALMRMSKEELDDELERLRAELHDLEEEKKESKSASSDEFIFVDNYAPTYSVIKLNSKRHNEGEQLIIELGST